MNVHENITMRSVMEKNHIKIAQTHPKHVTYLVQTLLSKNLCQVTLRSTGVLEFGVITTTTQRSANIDLTHEHKISLLFAFLSQAFSAKKNKMNGESLFQ